MKLIFICPYFGKLPNYFELWLKSCEANSDINWIIITDDQSNFNFPVNVKKISMSFEEFRELVQSKFEFKISLNTPYKLCDFKPTYGYILSDWIKEYDYWGHCDLDCIFGDLSKFLLNLMEEGYDKILALGHMTLYKNEISNNKRFMLNNTKINYEIVLSQEKNFAFDEWNLSGNINDIYEEYKFSFYDERIYADICCIKFPFCQYIYDRKNLRYIKDKKKQVFFWKEGKLLECYLNTKNEVIKKEIAYLHLQKREMKNLVQKPINNMLIVPNEFKNLYGEIDSNLIEKNSKKNYLYIAAIKIRLKNLKTKIIKLKKISRNRQNEKYENI